MSDENNVDPLSWLLPYLLMKCCGKFNAGTILSFLSWKCSGYWYWYIISIQMLPKIIFTFYYTNQWPIFLINNLLLAYIGGVEKAYQKHNVR